MRHDERTNQLRRIRSAEKRDPVENAFFAFVALTDDQKLSFVAQYQKLVGGRDYNRHVKISAVLHDPGVRD